jgi:hypothetical protein
MLSKALHRFGVIVAVAFGGFILGSLTALWMTAVDRVEMRSLSEALRANVLQNEIATATINARSGKFELARQQASAFFSDLEAELRNENSAFTTERQAALKSLLTQRDDTITTLARSDLASGERLTALYFKYLQGKDTAIPVTEKGTTLLNDLSLEYLGRSIETRSERAVTRRQYVAKK